MMTAEEAIQVALKERGRFDVAAGFQAEAAEKRIIELVAPVHPVRDEMPKPGKTRDVVAWIVTLGFGPAKAWFAVEDTTGEIVRVRKSRNAALYHPARKTKA